MMSLNPCRTARAAAVLVGFTLAAILGSKAEAQPVPSGASAPEPSGIIQSPPAAGRAPDAPRDAGEVRLDAMGPTDQCAEMRPITAVNTNIDLKSTGNERPEDVGAVCHPAKSEPLYTMSARAWSPVCYFWEAPVLAYGPLYFEENNLERYGYSDKCLRGMQPLVSSAQFFGTVALTPYLLVAEPPHECVYTLGEYRPGSCVPFQWNYPYFSPCAGWCGDEK